MREDRVARGDKGLLGKEAHSLTTGLWQSESSSLSQAKKQNPVSQLSKTIEWERCRFGGAPLSLHLTPGHV